MADAAVVVSDGDNGTEADYARDGSEPRVAESRKVDIIETLPNYSLFT